MKERLFDWVIGEERTRYADDRLRMSRGAGNGKRSLRKSAADYQLCPREFSRGS